jgi:tetratricopeptide (TPR) repeat protein
MALGNLEGAMGAFESVLGLDTAPAVRARALVGRARAQMGRADIDGALEDLEEALTIAPDHPAALVSRAEIAYRNHDWEEARRIFNRLRDLPGSDDAISPGELAFRRAELAEIFGDESDAHAAFREVVTRDPEHLAANEALAQIALYRGNLAEAAHGFEQVLRLLPRALVDKVCETRQVLGGVYLALGDYAAARHHLELVVAGSPNREDTLDLLVKVYERLGEPRKVVSAYERLARLHSDSAKRAEAVFRQGEILRVLLGDRDAARDAYLRATDLDATFVPARARLVRFAWERGDLRSVVDIGAELADLATPERLAGEADGGLDLLIGLAAAALGRYEIASAVVYAPALTVEAAGERLSELAQARGRPVSADDPVVVWLAGLGRAGFGAALADLLAGAAPGRA